MHTEKIIYACFQVFEIKESNTRHQGLLRQHKSPSKYTAYYITRDQSKKSKTPPVLNMTLSLQTVTFQKPNNLSKTSKVLSDLQNSPSPY